MDELLPEKNNLVILNQCPNTPATKTIKKQIKKKKKKKHIYCCFQKAANSKKYECFFTGFLQQIVIIAKTFIFSIIHKLQCCLVIIFVIRMELLLT